MAQTNPLVFRIPNLPSGPLVDEKGMPTAEELNFRQALLVLLQRFLGNEGLVMPSQTSDNITAIQNHTLNVPGAGTTTYTCQFGTMLYNSTANSIQIAIDDGSGVPLFKTVTLT